MPFINLKTKDYIITLKSDKVSSNIFIDLTEKSEEKIKILDKAITKKGSLDDLTILKLQQKQIIAW